VRHVGVFGTRKEKREVGQLPRTSRDRTGENVANRELWSQKAEKNQQRGRKEKEKGNQRISKGGKRGPTSTISPAWSRGSGRRRWTQIGVGRTGKKKGEDTGKRTTMPEMTENS